MTAMEQRNEGPHGQGDVQKATGHALSTAIAKYVAGILIAGMAVYACVQYVLLPDETVMRLVFEHLGHVVFLMLLVYIILYFVLLKVVVGPIHGFRAKLY